MMPEKTQLAMFSSCIIIFVWTEQQSLDPETNDFNLGHVFLHLFGPISMKLYTTFF